MSATSGLVEFPIWRSDWKNPVIAIVPFGDRVVFFTEYNGLQHNSLSERQEVACVYREIGLCGEEELISNTIQAGLLNDCNYSLKHSEPVKDSLENRVAD